MDVLHASALRREAYGIADGLPGERLADPAIRPTGHIFVASNAPWFTITDDLPQHAGHAIAAGGSKG